MIIMTPLNLSSLLMPSSSITIEMCEGDAAKAPTTVVGIALYVAPAVVVMVMVMM